MTEHDPLDIVPTWRVRALVAVEVLAGVGLVALVVLAVMGAARLTARTGVPVEVVLVALAFPLGALLRLSVELPRAARLLREWHQTAARRVIGPPSTWFVR